MCVLLNGSLLFLDSMVYQHHEHPQPQLSQPFLFSVSMCSTVKLILRREWWEMDDAHHEKFLWECSENCWVPGRLSQRLGLIHVSRMTVHGRVWKVPFCVRNAYWNVHITPNFWKSYHLFNQPSIIYLDLIQGGKNSSGLTRTLKSYCFPVLQYSLVTNDSVCLKTPKESKGFTCVSLKLKRWGICWVC